MNPEIVSICLVCMWIAVLLYVIVRTARLLRRGGSMCAVFFLFSAISLLLSYFYWLAYDLLRPEVRMPFAANELGEDAAFLLLASALNAAFRDELRPAKREAVLSALFTAACVALWIAWSGEWVDDILCGLAFGYLLFSVVRALRIAGEVPCRGWIVLCLFLGVLLALQGAIFFVPAPLKTPLDSLCYVMMFFSLAVVFFRAVRAMRANAPARRQLVLSVCTYAWSLCCLYMSADPWYLIILALSTSSFLLMMHAVEKEAAAT